MCEGHGALGLGEAHAVQQLRPLAELAFAGLRQVEGAARAELDLELLPPLIVDEELDELQGELSGPGKGQPQALTPPSPSPSGAIPSGSSLPLALFLKQKQTQKWEPGVVA